MARSMKAPKLGNQKKAVVLPLSTELSDSPDFLVDGMVRLNLASGKLEYAINNVWRSMARVGTTVLHLQDTVGDGTTTDFVLDHTVATESDIIVFVGGVYQQPLISYTLSTSVGTSTITFTSPPPVPGSNPNRIVVIYHLNSNDAD